MAGGQQQFTLQMGGFHSNLTNDFRELWKSQLFTDVTLVCDGQTCKAHKMVLGTSPYFSKIFQVNGKLIANNWMPTKCNVKV
jgi:hypothetical protein